MSAQLRQATTKKRFRFFTGVDLTHVAGVRVKVRRPDGAISIWTCVKETPLEAGIVYYDLGPCDLPIQTGEYLIYGELVYNDGVVASDDLVGFQGIANFN